METKQTAVNYIQDKLILNSILFRLSINDQMEIGRIIRYARSMHEKQIKDAFVECWKANVPDGIECKLDAEQYYNETYGK